MDFLKAILGDDLYSQVETKINEHNGNEANKDKLIKLANLASGDYVGKGKHDALQTQFDSQKAELETANNLIAELKKGTKGNEDLQAKITGYETQVEQLQTQLAETKLKAAIKVALLSEKAMDIDYLTFKLESKLKDENRTLELDENDGIKGWNDILSGLKVQFPNQFEGSGSKNIQEHKLESGDDSHAITKEQILKMPYQERARFYTENQDGYKETMHK